MTNRDTYDQKEEEILSGSTRVFMMYGIRSVTMDELARRMHISKKTLYRYVKNKSDLVKRCVEWDGRRMHDQLMEVRAKGLNAIEENIAYSGVVINEIKDIHPSIFFDLEKYYPDAWLVLDQLRYGFVSELVKDNLKKGMDDRWYRDDINVAIMTRLWVLRLNLIFTPAALPRGRFSISEVYREMVVHHLRGIASDKGLEYLQTRGADFECLSNSPASTDPTPSHSSERAEKGEGKPASRPRSDSSSSKKNRSSDQNPNPSQ